MRRPREHRQLPTLDHPQAHCYIDTRTTFCESWYTTAVSAAVRRGGEAGKTNKKNNEAVMLPVVWNNLPRIRYL